MSRWLGMLAGLLVLAGCATFGAGTPGLPFATMTEAGAAATDSGIAGYCPGGVLVAQAVFAKSPDAETVDARLLVVMGGPPRRFIYVDFTAQVIYFGVLREDDHFTVLETLPLALAKAKYPGPCDYLAPQMA